MMSLKGGVVLFFASAVVALATPQETRLQEGTWGAFITVEENTRKGTAELHVVDGELRMELVDSNGGCIPVSDLQLEDERLSFSFEEATLLIACTLLRQEEGDYKGRCSAGEVTAEMHLVPPTGMTTAQGSSLPCSGSIGAQVSVPTETTAASNVSAVPGGTEPVTIAGGRTLAAIFSEDLDENLREHLAVSRRNAVDWQTDARLHEVRLNVGDGGQVTWRFHWLSDSSDHSVQFFTSSPSLKVVIEDDPEASERPTLGIEETVGFNALGEILAANGVDLSSIDTEAVSNLELSFQDWRSPPGYYYYVFLTTGGQHYVVAATGEFQQ